MIDVKHQISEVRRELGTRTLEAGEARVITISRTYNGSLDDVWDTCTNPERIPRWFLPISGDLRLGGRYQLEGNAGGMVERCDPPHSFAATWEMGDQTSWIEVRLTSRPDGQVRFELEHVAHVADEFWTQYGPGAVGVGWDSMLLGLSLYLSGSPMDPSEGLAWSASPEGHEFFSLSSDAWRRASIAAGTPEPDAQAAADRTTAFYTGT